MEKKTRTQAKPQRHNTLVSRPKQEKKNKTKRLTEKDILEF